MLAALGTTSDEFVRAGTTRSVVQSRSAAGSGTTPRCLRCSATSSRWKPPAPRGPDRGVAGGLRPVPPRPHARRPLPGVARAGHGLDLAVLASGLRSSWLASATNRRCASDAASIRSSIVFMAVASAATSSSATGTGSRVCRFREVMVAACRRIASTGPSVRPTDTKAAAATTRTSSGMPTRNADHRLGRAVAVQSTPGSRGARDRRSERSSR